MRYLSLSTRDTEEIGALLAAKLAPGDVIAVSGDLGAGKTHLAKGVARGLGVTATVTSPTFTIIKEYQGRLPFYHMDVYRLEDVAELAELGYEEYFFGDGVTLVEWADRVRELLPPDHLAVSMETGPQEESRILHFHPHGERYLNLVEELKHRVRAGN